MQRPFFKVSVLTTMGLVIVGILLAGCNVEPSGESLYILNCASCHGTTGRGGLAAALGTPSYLAAHDDTLIARTTREGKPTRVCEPLARQMAAC